MLSCLLPKQHQHPSSPAASQRMCSMQRQGNHSLFYAAPRQYTAPNQPSTSCHEHMTCLAVAPNRAQLSAQHEQEGGSKGAQPGGLAADAHDGGAAGGGQQLCCVDANGCCSGCTQSKQSNNTRPVSTFPRVTAEGHKMQGDSALFTASRQKPYLHLSVEWFLEQSQFHEHWLTRHSQISAYEVFVHSTRPYLSSQTCQPQQAQPGVHHH